MATIKKNKITKTGIFFILHPVFFQNDTNIDLIHQISGLVFIHSEPVYLVDIYQLPNLFSEIYIHRLNIL